MARSPRVRRRRSRCGPPGPCPRVRPVRCPRGLRPARGSLTLAFCNLEAFDRFDPAPPLHDYDGEDELIRRWKRAYADVAAVEIKRKPPAHRYRHPKAPGEGWHRPEEPTSYSQRRVEYY